MEIYRISIGEARAGTAGGRRLRAVTGRRRPLPWHGDLSPGYADGARPPSQYGAADRDPRHRSAALHQWSYAAGSGHMPHGDHLPP